MKGIRVALMLVALGIGAPVALLAWRALDGLAMERAVRHQAVAERAFDEMERALSQFLAREEARPFEHYAFYLRSGERSPLSHPGEEPFLVGAFQVDPDGDVHTPLRPREVDTARARGDWPAEPGREEAIGRIVAAVASAWQEEEVAPLAAAAQEKGDLGAFADDAGEQAPGATLALGGRLAKKRAAAADLEIDARAEPVVEQEGVYEILRQLNRGAGVRSDRRRKVSPETYYGSAAESSEQSAPEMLAEAKAPSAPMGESALDALGDSSAIAAAPSPSELRPQRSDDAQKREARVVVRPILEPMLGRSGSDGALILYRTVLVGQQGYRQGLVLDRAALGAWLEQEVVAATDLGRFASLSFDRVAGPVAPDAEGVFAHRFAEPFHAVTATMRLAGLPGTSGPGSVHALVALLVAVGAVGLFAVYRMVAVVVQFAERRNNFVSAVTHELKTPLTAIRMYAEMLRDGIVRDDEKRESYYETITDESERLSRLIDNVLEFSRLEHGRREMSFTVGPPGPILEEAVAKLAAHTRREGFTLSADVATDLPAVRFDRDALLQVLFNLVDNAMKYARGASDRRIVVEARCADGGVRISVRDFGPGVSQKQLSKIFEAFYRGENELTRNTKGTGIGLALVKELAEAMGAAVSGANAADGGFRVGLAFPAA
jgi:signal transduction histidine kinase